MELSGYFNENINSSHLEIREKVLNNVCLSSTAQSLTPLFQISDSLFEQLYVFKERLNKYGFVFLTLERALIDDELISLCNALGTPLHERPDEISKFVRRDIILEVREAFKDAPDVSMQPFSKDAILVHTENSRSPVSEQPRYIVFQCIDSVGDDCPTYLFPMKSVADSLSRDDREILQKTYYYQSQRDITPILRMVHGKPIFSFRDFGPNSLKWKYLGKRSTSMARVNCAIEALLTAIYKENHTEVNWEPNALFIFDNFRFFHAKPENMGNPKNLIRHLDRVRIA